MATSRVMGTCAIGGQAIGTAAAQAIQKGCDMLGMELTDVMALCIEGMREHMDELGLGPKA